MQNFFYLLVLSEILVQFFVLKKLNIDSTRKKKSLDWKQPSELFKYAGCILAIISGTIQIVHIVNED